MISNQRKKFNVAASYKTALLHSSAATVIYTLQRFFETINLLVLKRDHYNEETKMRKSRTTLIKGILALFNGGSETNFCLQNFCSPIKNVPIGEKTHV